MAARTRRQTLPRIVAVTMDIIVPPMPQMPSPFASTETIAHTASMRSISFGGEWIITM